MSSDIQIIDFILGEPVEKQTFINRLIAVLQKLQVNLGSDGVSVDSSMTNKKFTLKMSAQSAATAKFLEYLKTEKSRFEIGYETYKIHNEETISQNSSSSNLKSAFRPITSPSQLSDSFSVVGDESRNLSENVTMGESFLRAIPQHTSSVIDAETSSMCDQSINTESDEGLKPAAASNDAYCMSTSIMGSIEAGEDNRVEFFSNKPILDDNDLDMLLLYAENRRRSGGGETISYALDLSRRHLTVTYRDASSKEEVLKKGTHIFNNFILIANEPFDKKKFQVDRLTIVLSGIPTNISEEVLSIYVENLVAIDDPENTILSISRSGFIPSIVSFRIEKPYDEKKLMSRIHRRPKLSGQTIKFIKAFETRMIVVRLPANSPDMRETRELIELHFSNPRRSGANSYESMQMREPFIFFVYKSQQDCLNVLSREHIVGGQKLQIDYLYNFDLFATYESSITSTACEVSDKSSTKLNDTTANSSTLGLDKLKLTSQDERQDEALTQDMTIVDHEKSATTKNQPDLTPMKSHDNDTTILNRSDANDVLVEDNNDDDSDDDDDDDDDDDVANEPVRPAAFINITSEQFPQLKVIKLLESVRRKLSDELATRRARLDPIEDDKNNSGLSVRVSFIGGSTSMPDEELQTVESEWEQEMVDFFVEFLDNYVIKTVTINANDSSWSLERLKFDANKCSVSMRGGQVELVGEKAEIDRLVSSMEEKVVDDRLESISLPRIRILLVNKYARQVKEKFPNCECKVDTGRCCVIYRGLQSEVKEAKQMAHKILASINHQILPVDKLVVKFFRNKEKAIVDWIRSTKEDLKCVIDPVLEESRLDIYSLEKSQASRLCDLVKAEFEPLLEIDSSFVNEMTPENLAKFIDWLKQSDNNEFERSADNFMRIVAFKLDRDAIYSKCLEYLTI